jgi:acyl-coenzyme A thioesterase PaaI-like protein
VATTVLEPANGVTETALAPYVRNSFGALNGGVAAALAAQAAQLCAATRSGATMQVDDLAVHHLGQGRVGPVRTRARHLLARAGREVVRVELHDVGSTEHGGDGRLMVVGHVGLSPVPTRD